MPNFAAVNLKPMNYLKTIRAVIMGILLFAGCHSAFAQDLIASQAPIDRRLKSVDSVALHRLFKKEVLEEKINLYTSWNTENPHYSAKAELPDSFKIDLRGFTMPTPSRKVTSRYGYRRSFRRMHYGVDVKVYTGDTIYAAFDGKARIVRYEGKGYGKYIVLRHDNGLETYYAHLSKQFVEVGEEVKSGQPIGLGGNTGRSYGSHLHFETRFLGKPINPEFLFDFPNQDVTADYYVFRSGKKSQNNSLLLANNTTPKHEQYFANNTNTPKQTSSGRYYKVRKGDSLYVIANRLGLTINQLCNANRITKKTILRPGQILKY